MLTPHNNLLLKTEGKSPPWSVVAIYTMPICFMASNPL